MLKEQFRMHPDLRGVVSDFAYGGQLRDAAGLETLRAPLAAAPPAANHALALCDVSHLGATRFFDRARDSRFNPVSALVSLRLLLEAREHTDLVVVLTPYRTQARLLAALIGDSGLSGVEIGTVHRYQGSEAPVVILDLVDTSGRAVGMPLRSASGERLLTVGLSRAQGKLIVVGSRAMPGEGLSARSIGALRAVRQHALEVPKAPWRRAARGGFALEMFAGVPPELESVASSDLVAAWLPETIPPGLQGMGGSHAERWQPGHPAWLLRSGAAGLHAGPGCGTTFVLTDAPRFAEALSDAITGTPLTRRSGAGAASGQVVTRASRYDACGRCGSRVIPHSATRYSVDLRCLSCDNTRRASDREIGAWLREVGPRCPNPRCRAAMRLISGRHAPHGPFFGCTSFRVGCTSTLPLEALPQAALHPDPPPPPAAVPSRTPTRAAPAGAALDEKMCVECFCIKAAAQFRPGSDVCRDCEGT